MNAHSVLARNRSFPLALLLLAVVAALGVVVPASPAHADAYGCTLSSNGKRNCIRIHSFGGSGPDVDWIKATHEGSAVEPVVCEVQFLYTITRSATLLASGKSPVISGCSLARGWTFQIDRTFPSGSKACIRSWEQGRLTPGEPCKTIY
jgi:hypothetical protein